jgi:hypothetical protein
MQLTQGMLLHKLNWYDTNMVLIAYVKTYKLSIVSFVVIAMGVLA